jgi:hypothetical protein
VLIGADVARGATVAPTCFVGTALASTCAQPVHNYRLDRLEPGQQTQAAQSLEAWLAKRRPKALTEWMQQATEAGQIPLQRVGLLAICDMQGRRVNIQGCKEAFGLLST